MGDFRVRAIKDKTDRHNMYAHALRDIEAFNLMWKENLINDGPIHIGAEQELCLVNEHFLPSNSALKVLDIINDEHYTNELGLFNMEINLDPDRLENSCFSKQEHDLLNLLDKGRLAAAQLNEEILMAGILPTLDVKHLDFDYMTPIPRYQTLSKMLHGIRGTDFEIYLQGVDDFMLSLGSVLFEACNTSFQLHLQLKPEEFVDKFNWSQMISAPVLAVGTNSPLLFGRELWSESRIALFKQSLDTRNSKNHLRRKIPRVYFGDEWLKDSPIELWKNELIRFPLIITSDDLKDSVNELHKGEIPELRAIRLHNGTTYTWNRLCYGPGKSPHIRIECRYLPAGPSAVDEIANFVFWVGLMNNAPANWSEEIKQINFRSVKANFIKAARTGIESVFNWKGKKISAKELILEELLPMAEQGLQQLNINADDIRKYLGIIAKRLEKNQNGSQWTIDSYRKLSLKHSQNIAKQEIVAQMIEYQKQNVPVHEWDKQISSYMLDIIDNKQIEYTAAHFMSTKIFAVREDTSLDFVKAIFKWKNIHHLPVENKDGLLTGIITDGLLNKHKEENSNQFAADIMKRDVISIDRDTKIEQVISILENNQLSGVPVVRNQKLVGIITKNDLIGFMNQ